MEEFIYMNVSIWRESPILGISGHKPTMCNNILWYSVECCINLPVEYCGVLGTQRNYTEMAHKMDPMVAALDFLPNIRVRGPAVSVENQAQELFSVRLRLVQWVSFCPSVWILLLPNPSSTNTKKTKTKPVIRIQFWNNAIQQILC